MDTRKDGAQVQRLEVVELGLLVFTCCNECDGAQAATATVVNTTADRMLTNKN